MARLGAPAQEQSCLVRALKACGVGCAVLVLLALIVFLAIRAKLTSPPRLPPLSTPVASTAAPSVEQQLKAIQEAAKSGRRQAVELRVSEAELNRVAQEQAAGSKELSNLQVRLTGDQMTVSATVQTGSVLGTVPLTATGRPTVTDGRLRFVADSVQAGTMKLPPDALQQRLDQAFGSFDLAKEGVQVTGVRIANGELTLSGTTMPPR